MRTVIFYSLQQQLKDKVFEDRCMQRKESAGFSFEFLELHQDAFHPLIHPSSHLFYLLLLLCPVLGHMRPWSRPQIQIYCRMTAGFTWKHYQSIAGPQSSKDNLG